MVNKKYNSIISALVCLLVLVATMTDYARYAVIVFVWFLSLGLLASYLYDKEELKRVCNKVQEPIVLPWSKIVNRSLVMLSLLSLLIQGFYLTIIVFVVGLVFYLSLKDKNNEDNDTTNHQP